MSNDAGQQSTQSPLSMDRAGQVQLCFKFCVVFLRDFGYDTELIGRDEVDETQLLGLKGVVKISHIVFNGASLLRLDGFAPFSRWEELSPANLDNPRVA